MTMRPLDLEGVPEPQARAIEEQVRYWQAEGAAQVQPRRGELPVWRGKVVGRLTRVELYDDDD